MAELISNPIRIPCGGFDIDNDTLYFQNDVLKSKREEPELPSVSDVDDGNVLTVVEGSWAKAAPSGGGGGTNLPTYTASDIGKSLSVVSTGSHTETVTIIQEQTLTLTPGQSPMDPVAHLAAGTYDFSSLSAGDTVTGVLSVDGEPGPTTGDVVLGAMIGLNDELLITFGGVVVGSNGNIYSVIEGALTISVTASVTIHEPSIDWAKPSPLMCTFDLATFTLDKTWQEIHDAMEAGLAFVQVVAGNLGNLLITSVWEEGGIYGVNVLAEREGTGTYGVQQFTTDSASGYPMFVSSSAGGGGSDGPEVLN